MPDQKVSPITPPQTRRKILVHAGNPPQMSAEFRFDAVIEKELAAAVVDYDMVIPADHLREQPLGGDSLNLAFLCREVDAYLRVVSMKPPGDIILYPSAVAVLDMLRQGRLTLIAARELSAGHILMADDLDEEIGGPGVGLNLSSTLIGRRVLYPLIPGQAIDFGYISEDFEEQAL